MKSGIGPKNNNRGRFFFFNNLGFRINHKILREDAKTYLKYLNTTCKVSLKLNFQMAGTPTTVT